MGPLSALVNPRFSRHVGRQIESIVRTSIDILLPTKVVKIYKSEPTWITLQLKVIICECFPSISRPPLHLRLLVVYFAARSRSDGGERNVHSLNILLLVSVYMKLANC